MSSHHIKSLYIAEAKEKKKESKGGSLSVCRVLKCSITDIPPSHLVAKAKKGIYRAANRSQKGAANLE